MKKNLFLVLIAVVCITPSLAQSSFSIQYSMGFGGNMNDFVSTTSLRGATFEYKLYPQPNISIGIDAGWNHYYERRAYDTYTSGTLSITGVQFRYADAVPIFVTTSYYFSPGEKINPFIGLGIGSMYVSRYLDMGSWRVTEDDWHFAVKPEVGVLVNANPDMDIIFCLRYNNAFETNDTKDQTYMTFNIGFVWK